MKLGNPLIVDVNNPELETRNPPWYSKPIRRKLLWKDPQTGGMHLINCYPADLNAPAHHHNCAHTMLILKGKMVINGKTYGAGTYARFPAGETMVHTTPPDSDCTFLMIFESEAEFSIEGGKTYKIT